MSDDLCPFCLQEIRRIRNAITTITAQLPKLRALYDKYKGSGLKREIDSLADLQKTVFRLLEVFPALIQHLTEYGDETVAGQAIKLYRVMKRYDYLGSSDYKPLCMALTAFADSLPADDETVNKAALGHLMNRVRMGYFPTDSDHVEILRQALSFPAEPFNAIDPCCGEGLALKQLTDGSSAVTYGIELDEVRAEEAQARLNRVGFGSFFHSRISLNAYQCLFLNPPYLAIPSETGGTRRLEKAFLADSLRLLEPGGVLIYIVPPYRATPDVCRALCENTENLRVYRFLGAEYERFHQVVFIGTRIPRREANRQSERLTEYLLSPENIPPITALRGVSYSVPPYKKPVELFKGAVFNVSELALQLRRSGSLERLFPGSALDRRERRPLLPLNISQIGLVGASGLMNGLMECDTPHIIKGRIIRERREKAGAIDENGKQEIRVITSNKLIFNVLSPSGFRSLG